MRARERERERKRGRESTKSWVEANVEQNDGRGGGWVRVGSERGKTTTTAPRSVSLCSTRGKINSANK